MWNDLLEAELGAEFSMQGGAGERRRVVHEEPAGPLTGPPLLPIHGARPPEALWLFVRA